MKMIFNIKSGTKLYKNTKLNYYILKEYHKKRNLHVSHLQEGQGIVL